MARARAGTFFYLVGGDPGLVPKILRGSPLWDAIVDAWRGGAALGGSSAGAMALGGWTLIRERMPGDSKRRYGDALNLVPGIAVLPHFDTFGKAWVDSALERAPAGTTLVGLDERTAAVWTQGVWQALGAGGVTLITHTERRTFELSSADRWLVPAGRHLGPSATEQLDRFGDPPIDPTVFGPTSKIRCPPEIRVGIEHRRHLVGRALEGWFVIRVDPTSGWRTVTPMVRSTVVGSRPSISSASSRRWSTVGAASRNSLGPREGRTR